MLGWEWHAFHLSNFHFPLHFFSLCFILIALSGKRLLASHPRFFLPFIFRTAMAAPTPDRLQHPHPPFSALWLTGLSLHFLLIVIFTIAYSAILPPLFYNFIECWLPLVCVCFWGGGRTWWKINIQNTTVKVWRMIIYVHWSFIYNIFSWLIKQFILLTHLRKRLQFGGRRWWRWRRVEAEVSCLVQNRCRQERIWEAFSISFHTYTGSCRIEFSQRSH